VILPRPRTLAGAVGLQVLLSDPRDAVVAVDFDGTLAPIVARPGDVRPARGAIEALTAIGGLVAACAVVTGRAAEEAVRLGGLAAVPGLVVYGHYGLQRWAAGELDSPPAATEIELARPLLEAVVASAPDGVHLEDKEHSLALHTRPAADPAGALESVVPAVSAIAERFGLETVPGRFVVEVRPPGTNKGLAVRRLVDEAGAHVAVYVGDDLGDLAAFDAIDAMRAEGGGGLTIASVGADAPPQLAQRADLILDGPDAVAAFLRDLAAAARTSPE
jgi:trehalose 6-phosphate phosphatase